MRFQPYNVGYLQRDDVVEVELSGTEANVQLLDSANLQRYKNGGQFTYHGGHYKQSPARVTVPHAGTWYVTVDLGGYGGQVSSSVRIIKP